MVLIPDYDSDPERWRRGIAPRDVHEVVGPELLGPVLDAGCGEGRLVATLLEVGVGWVGLDLSASQLAAALSPAVAGPTCGAAVRGRLLRQVTCTCGACTTSRTRSPAVAEARRVLRPGGRYYACTAARDNDPEIMPEGYPATTFDAEEADAHCRLGL